MTLKKVILVECEMYVLNLCTKFFDSIFQIFNNSYWVGKVFKFKENQNLVQQEIFCLEINSNISIRITFCAYVHNICIQQS